MKLSPSLEIYCVHNLFCKVWSTIEKTPNIRTLCKPQLVGLYSSGFGICFVFGSRIICNALGAKKDYKCKGKDGAQVFTGTVHVREIIRRNLYFQFMTFSLITSLGFL